MGLTVTSGRRAALLRGGKGPEHLPATGPFGEQTLIATEAGAGRPDYAFTPSTTRLTTFSRNRPGTKAQRGPA